MPQGDEDASNNDSMPTLKWSDTNTDYEDNDKLPVLQDVISDDIFSDNEEYDSQGRRYKT